MKWQFIKKIFDPIDLKTPLTSHASNPTAIKLRDGIHRIYFSSRDSKNRAHISYFDTDFDNNFQISHISERPIIPLGDRGSFDENGMTVGSIVKTDGKIHLYYMGWNIAQTVPFRNSIGMLFLNNEMDEYERFSVGPLLDRSHNDPFSISYPFVMCDENKWKMWYGSHKKWGDGFNDMQHGIKYAESLDGIKWSTNKNFCIAPEPNDYAFSRPFVIKEEGLYKMWYCYRGTTYKLGYAESANGINWQRLDSIEFQSSSQEWDSEMTCYPCIIDYNGKRYMLYNGNGYGKTGIGISILS